MGPIKTTIVGSLPKPAWLSDPEQLRAPWRQAGTALEEAQDDAVALSLTA
ncbi:MAG: 5-methyltetrahydropteroyltriglutamate--homocysteine methyltransferase, partial [Alphaproteobacteria bacterium]